METQGRLTAVRALQLAAPHTWAASVCPAIFGIVYCGLKGYGLSIWRMLMLVAACILLQSSVNTLNDYVDFVKGTDSEEDNVSEDDSAIIYGHLDPKKVLILGIIYMLAGILAGVIASVGAGPAPLIVGVIGGLVLMAYSFGPFPVSYSPLGEVVSGTVMGGMIPMGITAAATGSIKPEVLIWSLPLIIGIALIMMSNNGSDIEKDKQAGRRTLPVLLGREHTVTLFRILMGLWIILICLLPLMGGAGVKGLVAAVILLIPSRKLFKALTEARLLPGDRIGQMKSIAKANILCNGAYIIATAMGLLGAIHV